MQNSEYWKKRFKQLEESSHKDAAQAFSEIESQFTAAQREIERQVSTWYARFAKNNEITIQEARKWLSDSELKELKWDVKEYIKYGQENDLNSLWMKELENASAKFHISRLEALKLQTQMTCEKVFGNQLDVTEELLKRTYLEGYYHSAFEIQKGFNLGWDIAPIDERQLSKVIKKPWSTDGKNFSDRIWSNRSSLIQETHRQLTQNILLGRSPDDSIKAIAKKFDVSKNQAGRLVMTETAYFNQQAQKDCFNDLGVEQFEVIETLDGRTCEICGEMDGQVFDMKDFEPGTTAPPFHPWCRGCTAPFFDDNFTERAARNADGQTYYVPSDTKYKDWKESFVDGETKEGLTPVAPDDMIKSKDDTLDAVMQGKNEQVLNVDENLVGDGIPIEDERTFKELSLEEFKAIKHSISKEERKIVYGKTHFSGYINSSNARKMNEIMRQGGQLPSEYQKIADTLQGIIDKNSLPDDVMVTRYVSGDALESIVGVKMPTATLKTKKEDFFAKLDELPNLVQKGHVYTEKAFLSTSGVFDKNVMKDKQIMLKIKAPKGTSCYVTTNNRESEIIFGQGTKLKISDTKIEGSGTSDWKVVLECEIVP